MLLHTNPHILSATAEVSSGHHTISVHKYPCVRFIAETVAHLKVRMAGNVTKFYVNEVSNRMMLTQSFAKLMFSLWSVDHICFL